MSRLIVYILFFIILVSCTRKYKEYYSTGETKVVAHKNKNDGFEGIYLEFYKNGVLKTDAYYQNGIKNGEERKYFQNGLMLSKTDYVDGKKHGLEVIYDSLGNIIFETNFKNDLAHGEYLEFDSNGCKIEYCIYFNNQLAYREEFDSLNRINKIYWWLYIVPDIDSAKIEDSINFTIEGTGIRKPDQNIELLYSFCRQKYINKEGPYKKMIVEKGKKINVPITMDSIGVFALHGWYIVRNDTGFGSSVRFEEQIIVTQLPHD